MISSSWWSTLFDLALLQHNRAFKERLRGQSQPVADPCAEAAPRPSIATRSWLRDFASAESDWRALAARSFSCDQSFLMAPRFLILSPSSGRDLTSSTRDSLTSFELAISHLVAVAVLPSQLALSCT